MPSRLTVREVAERIVELGVVDASATDQVSPNELDKTLDYFGHSDDQAMLSLLDTLGIRYSADYKTFRYACESDGDGYRAELQHISECGRGLLPITEVEFVDDEDGDHQLEFICNGELNEWNIPHGDDEDFDAQLEFGMNLANLISPDSPARWCRVEPHDDNLSIDMVFGDPEALRALGAEFGVTFVPL